MYVLSKTVLVATNPYGNGFLYNGYQFEVQCHVTLPSLCARETEVALLHCKTLHILLVKALLVACLCFWPSYAVKLIIKRKGLTRKAAYALLD